MYLNYSEPNYNFGYTLTSPFFVVKKKNNIKKGNQLKKVRENSEIIFFLV